eukprot:TRINITY_DN3116_c0_g1_i1.p1 TRINITY_DN3116_c0_g1~~TRINITY_DN3116_c0_g1_i1.p1  ORF type:complete len:233 (+),score=31.27 TRINITY_DN3116_c0_g1_i1:65-763(+)
MKVFFCVVIFSLALSATCLQIPQRISTINDFEINTGSKLDNYAVLYSSCIDVDVLGDVCLTIFDDVDNLTLGLSLSFNNRTLFTQNWGIGDDCLDTQSILYLVAEIPVLKPFKVILDWIIKESKKIPGEIFSVCLEMYDVNITNNGTVLHGCALLNSTVACWKGKCAYKGIDNFGCFDVKIPHLETETLRSLFSSDVSSVKLTQIESEMDINKRKRDSNKAEHETQFNDVLW